MIKYYCRKKYPLSEPHEIVFRQPLWRDQVRKLERSDEPDAEADVARTGSEIIIAAGEQGVGGAIKLKRTFPRLVQM